MTTTPDPRPDELPRTAPAQGMADRQLDVTVAQAGQDIAVLSVAGEIDLLTANRLGERLRAELESAHRAIVLDLTAVTFLGSSGLAEIVSCSEAAKSSQVTLCMVATNRAVLRPFEVTGLLSVLTVYDTVEVALRECAA